MNLLQNVTSHYVKTYFNTYGCFFFNYRSQRAKTQVERLSIYIVFSCRDGIRNFPFTKLNVT